MGISSDGILVFGIDLGEDGIPFINGHDDFDQYLDDESGLPQWGESGHSYDALKAYRDSCPADVTAYCSYDYPMSILAVRGTEKRVSRGYSAEVSTLDIDPEKVAAFVAWCRARCIANPEPKWLLVSMYG